MAEGGRDIDYYRTGNDQGQDCHMNVTKPGAKVNYDPDHRVIGKYKIKCRDPKRAEYRVDHMIKHGVPYAQIEPRTNEVYIRLEKPSDIHAVNRYAARQDSVIAHVEVSNTSRFATGRAETSVTNPAPFRPKITDGREDEGTAGGLRQRYPEDARAIGREFGLSMNARRGRQRYQHLSSLSAIGFGAEVKRNAAINAGDTTAKIDYNAIIAGQKAQKEIDAINRHRGDAYAQGHADHQREQDNVKRYHEEKERKRREDEQRRAPLGLNTRVALFEAQRKDRSYDDGKWSMKKSYR